MSEYLDLSISPETHTIINYPGELPYSLKDFKVDLDYNLKEEEKLRENFIPLKKKEIKGFDRLNKEILTKRFD